MSDRNRTYSREEFLSWAEAQPRGRYEHVGGRIVEKPPERGAHLRRKAAIWLALRQAITEAKIACQALPDGPTVATGENDYEPDAVVNCGEPVGNNDLVAPRPVVVVEVLSPTTQGTDTGGKLADYFQVASIHHYLIVHPVQRSVIHHRRRDGQESMIDTRIMTAGEIVLDPPGITVTVEQFYELA
jgi:Uma2 family endonuclease